MVNGKKINRFLHQNPTDFKIIALMVMEPKVNLFSGEKEIGVACRIGSIDNPVNITPFLEYLEVYNA